MIRIPTLPYPASALCGRRKKQRPGCLPACLLAVCLLSACCLPACWLAGCLLAASRSMFWSCRGASQSGLPGVDTKAMCLPSRPGGGGVGASTALDPAQRLAWCLQWCLPGPQSMAPAAEPYRRLPRVWAPIYGPSSSSL